MTVSDEEAEALRAENEALKRRIRDYEQRPRPLTIKDFFDSFGFPLIMLLISFIIWALLR